MPSFKTLNRKGVKYALGSALRKSGHDIEYYSDRSRLSSRLPFLFHLMPTIQNFIVVYREDIGIN